MRLILVTGMACLVSAGLWYFQPRGLPIPENWPMGSITQSLLVLLAGLFISGLAQSLHARLQAGQGRWGILRRLLRAEQDKPVYELFWLLCALHILIWASIPILLLRVWGLYDQSALLFSTLATEGFKIGEKTLIVPSKILVGIFLFALLITATRWIKRRLNSRWLHHTPMHPGTREAVATMFGYITFILALLIGLTFAGFNLGSLAIIAGALGVGIGFGLQNIANNFISGLILLFERPIRPGDFISVGETTGFVRKVSIRSTELETLDRMSVIVPNSDMLANHVQNWTLRDPFGRIIIPVGVAYGSDTELVKKVLLEVAANNNDVIKEGHPFIPGPQVLFKGFGDSSLDFELRVFIRQVDKRLVIVSAINFAIDAAFREHRVNIPFPQRDVWFRNTPPAPPAEAGESP
ncbi:MAG: mechanosensitive ion channel domain-containing protein [Nevskiales bacterium]